MDSAQCGEGAEWLVETEGRLAVLDVIKNRDLELNVNFAFSEEQEQLREFVRQFLENYSPETKVRELMETEMGYDPDIKNVV